MKKLLFLVSIASLNAFSLQASTYPPYFTADDQNVIMYISNKINSPEYEALKVTLCILAEKTNFKEIQRMVIPNQHVYYNNEERLLEALHMIRIILKLPTTPTMTAVDDMNKPIGALEKALAENRMNNNSGSAAEQKSPLEKLAHTLNV